MSLAGRLKAAWDALVGSKREGQSTDGEGFLEIDRELAAVRLDLAEALRNLEYERAARRGLEQSMAKRVESETISRLEELLARLAPPLSQLRMQQQLVESGKPVAVEDMLALLRNLAEAIEQAGLEPIGRTGGTMPYDPELCLPLGSDVSFEPGREVLVSFIGYKYNRRTLRKALVAKKE